MTDQAPEITREQFVERFVAEMMKRLPIFNGAEADLRNYAVQAAEAYWLESPERGWTPEESVEADVCYWEEG